MTDLFRPSEDVVARLSVGTMRNLEDPLKLANAETWFQFPLFKGKKLLILPGVDQADPVPYYWLIGIEHFDLTEAGELAREHR